VNSEVAVSDEVPERIDKELLPSTTLAGKRRRKNARRQTIEWILLVVGAVALAVGIRAVLFQAFYIPTPSMVPTLMVNDRILVNKLAYRTHDPRRGDIVVFTTPPGEESADVKDLVKRVIGLPGETIEARNSRIFVTRPGESVAQQLDEPYVNKECAAPVSGEPLEKTVVPAGSYWVMGDNRCQSHDSRAFGPIKGSTIVGRAFIRIWPIHRIKFL
jgi:signal peptidase I